MRFFLARTSIYTARIRTYVRQRALTFLGFLVLSKLCQLLIGGRDFQQLALVLVAGYFLSLSTYLLCALSPVPRIMKGGHVRLLQSACDELSTSSCGRSFHLRRNSTLC